MIRDHMNQQDNFRDEIYKRRPIFLFAALLFIGLAVAAYLYDDQIIEATQQTPLKLFGAGPVDSGGGAKASDVEQVSSLSGEFTYVLILMVCIFMSALSVMCYRSPRLGNRLLGFGALDAVKDKDRSTKIFSTGLEFDSGSSEKKIHTRRREGRAARRKYGKITRELKEKEAADKAENSEDSQPTDKE